MDTLQTATLGLVSNLADAAMISVEVAYPSSAARATLQLFRDRFQFQGEAAIAAEPGLNYYRQRIVGRAGWNVGGLSLFLNGTSFESFGGSTSMRIDDPELSGCPAGSAWSSLPVPVQLGSVLTRRRIPAWSGAPRSPTMSGPRACEGGSAFKPKADATKR